MSALQAWFMAVMHTSVDLQDLYIRHSAYTMMHPQQATGLWSLH